MTVDHLLSWLVQNPGLLLPDGSTLETALNARNMTLSDLESLMIKTALRQYYGTSPSNWRPFGSKDEILTIMFSVQDRYNSMLRTLRSTERPLLWNIEPFTPLRLAMEKSVIVVDPLSPP